jgi:hypothetical protein
MLLDWLPGILQEVARLVRTQELQFTRWPVSIAPMDRKEIAQDKKNGGGHGVYLPDTEEIRLNTTMPPLGIILNLIHELWHHVDPRADEWYINTVIVPSIYDKLTGEVLKPVEWKEFRGHQSRWRTGRKK